MAGFRLQAFPLAAGFLAAVTAGLAGFMVFQVEPAFQAMTHLSILDFRLDGYERADVLTLIDAVRASPVAATFLRDLHLGPDLLFPAAYGLLCFLLIRRFAPGVLVFHKPMAGWRLLAALAVPVLYALADYAENSLSLMLFPPALPSPERIALLAGWLPLATRLKAMLFFITLILALRFVLFRDKGMEKAGA